MAIFSKRNIILYFLIILLIITGVIFMNIFSKKKEATEIIDSYITDKGYEDKIQEKEIAYDWKLGTYVATVTFKDEPNNTYEFYKETDSNNVYVIGYRKGEEITDKKDGKYIDN